MTTERPRSLDIQDGVAADEPEVLELGSRDIAAERIAQLRRFFPEVFREDRIDFNALQRSLGDWAEPERERFGLTWPGKLDCMRVIQQPSYGTLIPHREQSVDFDTTQNVVVEGDNLEVLKILQNSYHGKIKMIYIDPPYNMGNDFIYPDKYSEGLTEYLRYTLQVDQSGNHDNSSKDMSGRFHSRWLNMMYPRLFLARNLLRDDGVIFVSIDDNEVANLRCLMDEIFGEENQVACLIWKKSYGGGSKARYVVGLHEYVLVYARTRDVIKRIVLPPDPSVLKYYKFEDEKLAERGPFRLQPLSTTSMDDRPNLRYPIHWQGMAVWPEKQWQWSKARVDKALEDDELVISNRTGKWSVEYKQYLLSELGEERGAKPFTVLDGPYTQQGTEEVRSLFGDGKIFPFPKPSDLVAKFLEYVD